MTLNEENGRPRKTDRTEASDESAFEEQDSRRSSCAEQIVLANSAGEIAFCSDANSEATLGFEDFIVTSNSSSKIGT
jgi:hypothetical protein